ncbi:nitrogen regulatory protein P-II family [Sporobacter termitidis DSM 10068]|uniref:Nitrogen regulatory protein P-II family n=1 Tax=Sporobacter termitidis DSM 10068 TaxID=1123282 RepID=A0A1M5XF77_9FIRM|nr:P-II family nitrogen regulator [Sporobacter termitidis]SHH98312.1 nitrogen regulatory protein P-II family [Sporobacter termitidis DSM 10068]
MKDIVFIIRAEKLEIVKSILDEHGCGGMTVMTAMGCGTQRGFTDEDAVQEIKGYKTKINLLPKIRIEAVVEDELVESILLDVRERIATGKVGDGKVFIFPVEDAMRIRTGERGDSAI